jgi:hypothetical protein
MHFIFKYSINPFQNVEEEKGNDIKWPPYFQLQLTQNFLLIIHFNWSVDGPWDDKQNIRKKWTDKRSLKKAHNEGP